MDAYSTKAADQQIKERKRGYDYDKGGYWSPTI